MPILLLILLITTLGIDSACGTCVADSDWSVGEWGECSRSCGGGYQTRNRTRCCHDNESTETCLERCQSRSVGDVPETYRTCNKFCFNGGKFDENTGLCRCRQGWTSVCCQEVSTSYKFDCSITTSKTYQDVPPQAADGPETTSLSRVYVVKAQMPNEPFTKESFHPLNINMVIRLCSHNIQSINGCTIDQTSTSLNLLHNGTVIYNERYLGDVSHVFLEISQGDRIVEYDWIPEFLDVNDQDTHFYCSRDFSHSQHSDLGRHRRWANRRLKIVIRTSGSLSSGTDATVTMKINGEKASSRNMDMDGHFERRDVDTSMRSINEIGKIQSIRIWHNNQGSGPGWKLDWVHIYELSEPDVIYEFGCNCWLDGGRNGKDLRHRTDCPNIANCVTQRCRTCTTCQSRSKDYFFRLSTDGETCDRCPVIPNCQTQPCLTCDACNPPTKNNVIFKLTGGNTTCERSCQDMGSTAEMSLQWLSPDKERCDLTCSYVDNRWCWPGNCSSGLMTSCSCESGFRKSGNSTCDITTKADLLTCNIGIEDHRHEVRNSTSIGNTTSCYSQTDIYINIQPESMSFKITSECQKKILSTPPVYINRTYIGIVDSSLTVTRQDISGAEHILSSTPLRGGGNCNKTLSSSTPSPSLSCDRVLIGSSSLQNGEWLCGRIKVFSGGSFDYQNFHRDIIGNERFTPLSESKTICFRYDNAAPVHCTTDSRFPCSSATPMRLSTRTTRSPNITVEVSGWIDPYPLRGSPEKASGGEVLSVPCVWCEALRSEYTGCRLCQQYISFKPPNGQQCEHHSLTPIRACHVCYICGSPRCCWKCRV
ncbi:uncharacterized protein LOC124271467 [Haliotis rubra]|uniref:uncharacterized protein LOC124271467 n=1 Tax=Haliotis rubra TaxID=36100 RepID=UPI001EE520C5|nr:uncharacterized protein LOC124271467 [Haliotis rubra]